MANLSASDINLIKKASTGDTTAFGALITRYQGLVYSLAYMHIGRFADAEDIAQEVFIKAFRHLEQLRQPERFVAWLKQMTANECKMWRRRQHPCLSLEASENTSPHTRQAMQRWREEEKARELHQALQALSARSRLVITLHYLSELSHAEIANLLDLTANAVSQQIHRARQQLRGLLLEQMEDGKLMKKLPESFTQEVLARVSLCPISDSEFVTPTGNAEGTSETQGLALRLGASGPDAVFVTLWMKRDDLAAINPGLARPGETSGLAKAQAYDDLQQTLQAFGIGLKQIVLRLVGANHCLADAEFVHGCTTTTVELRASDALCLARCMQAPVFAEAVLADKANVIEGDVVPNENWGDAKTQEIKLNATHQLGILSNKAYEIGLSPEAMLDTVRYHVDEAAGVVRLWLEALPEKERTLPLESCRSGIDLLFEQARENWQHDLGRDGKHYRAYYAMLGDDARMRIVPAE
jgi:RNA polymerase sigma factor (sigma-70 family)